MKAGRMSERILFQVRTVTIVNEQAVITFPPEANYKWADVERTTEQNARFTVRYRSDVTPTSHRIVWEGCVWNITNAVHDRKKTMTVIESDFSALVEVTHLQSTETEYIDGIPVLHPRA